MNGRTSYMTAMMAAACGLAATAAAQAPAAAPLPPWEAPAVGALAPDFTLTGATRYGVLRTPVRLSDYRGQTVVVAFFNQARTKG